MAQCKGLKINTDVSTTIDLGSFFEKGVYKDFEPESCPYIAIENSQATVPVPYMELKVAMTLHFTTGSISETGSSFTAHGFKDPFAVRDQEVRALYKPMSDPTMEGGLIELTIPPNT